MAVFRRGRIWWYDFRFKGSRIRESTNATNRSGALQAEALRKAEIIQGKTKLQQAGPSPRFADFAHGEFSLWCSNEHRDNPSTYQRYMRSIKALDKFFAHKTLDTIDSGQVERFKLQRSQERRKNARDGRLVSPAAVNRDLATLRILFNFAIRLGKAQFNPVVGVKFFKENYQRMRILSPQEETQYLEAASPLLRDVAIIMLETGMRPGEVLGLRTSDVDLETGGVQVREGKTFFARRHIPLTERAVVVMKPRAANASNGLLFPSPTEATIPVRGVNHAHEAALRRSGIQLPFRLYDLRHTALSRMAMAGIDLATLKELAGHSQIQMTMRYIHPTPEHKRRVVDTFEAFCKTLRDDRNRVS